MPRFGSVVTAMVTPFDADGRSIWTARPRWPVIWPSSGSDGLVVAGTTGEGPVLTDAERIDLFRAVVEAVDVPVIASTGTNDTAHSVVLTERAPSRRGRRRAGGDAVLQPSLAGRAVRPLPGRGRGHRPAGASSTTSPSARAGGSAPTSPSSWPARCATIVGVKDATGDVAAAAEVVAEAPGRVRRLLRRRLPHPALRLHRRRRHHQRGRPLGRAAVRRDDRAATAPARWSGPGRINQRLAESYRFESTDEFPNPVPAKAACRALGLPVGQCRLPNPPAPAALDEQARAVMSRLSQHDPTHQSVA